MTVGFNRRRAHQSEQPVAAVQAASARRLSSPHKQMQLHHGNKGGTNEEIEGTTMDLRQTAPSLACGHNRLASPWHRSEGVTSARDKKAADAGLSSYNSRWRVPGIEFDPSP